MVIVMPFVKARNAVARALGSRLRVTVVGQAATERGARYGRQLASHLGRKVETEWDDATSTGTVTFDPAARLFLSTTPDALVLTLTCPASRVAELQDVVERHLVRFGAKDGLSVTWQSGGPEGQR
ncbi:DUF2218 domain-containing protein [Mobilicoccus massiliensis]|uniref:DUF2218 domain-containing protein n=1 Tax=Mobilicoccus massiliensis TaxID=1522310 RepID=UPI000694A9E4|nr:DUF2218 domain-containing protein [Mobilicoccus massiliensis]